MNMGAAGVKMNIPLHFKYLRIDSSEALLQQQCPATSFPGGFQPEGALML